MTKLRALISAEDLFWLLGLVCVVLAVARLAGTFWAVLLLGALLFYMAWVAHGNQSSEERIELEQRKVIDTAVHEALHEARLDHEALIGAVKAVTAQALDEIRTEARRVELQPAA